MTNAELADLHDRVWKAEKRAAESRYRTLAEAIDWLRRAEYDGAAEYLKICRDKRCPDSGEEKP